MSIQRTGLVSPACATSLNCGEIVTDVNFNKLVDGIKSIYSIGTCGAYLPGAVRNNVKQPICGWHYGTPNGIPTSANSGYEAFSHKWPLHLNAGYDRWSLDIEVCLMSRVEPLIPRAARIKMKRLVIIAYGYGGASQVLADVVQSTPGPGQHLVIANSATSISLSGVWNASMLPPAGSMEAGRIACSVTVSTEAEPPLAYGSSGSLNILARSEWYGLMNLYLNNFKLC